MKPQTAITILVLSLFATGCGGFSDYEFAIDDHYGFVRANSMDMDIYDRRNHAVLTDDGGPAYAIAWSDSAIAVKKHGARSRNLSPADSLKEVDESVTVWYIVRRNVLPTPMRVVVSNSSGDTVHQVTDSDRGILGPLTEGEYLRSAEQLGLGSRAFLEIERARRLAFYLSGCTDSDYWIQRIVGPYFQFAILLTPCCLLISFVLFLYRRLRGGGPVAYRINIGLYIGVPTIFALYGLADGFFLWLTFPHP